MKAFIQSFSIDGFEQLDKIDAEVKVEETFESGRIDIVIKPVKGKEIVIENKIYAGDQNMQLARYKGCYPTCHLIYLTLFGTEPSNASIIRIDKTSLIRDTDYWTKSYKDDVLNWLNLCRKEATAHPILRETITQYIYLIKLLTNQTMNEQNLQEIVTMVVKNPDNIESAKRIADSWKNIQLKIIDNIKLKILEGDEFILEDNEFINYSNFRIAFKPSLVMKD